MGDVVVITGASGGVGRATARRFAQDGAKIALLARGEAGLEATAKEVEERGGKALVLPTDVADADQVEAAAQAAESELGPIDIWVNDAMATIYAEFLDVEPDEYRRATDVTYHGMVWGTRAALQADVPSANRGTIVQVGSALAFRGIPLQAPYCGAKHACKGFTESVITEIKHHGWDIHVTMVHLPGVNTTAVHVGPHEAAEADAAGAADLPARGGRRRDPLGRVPQAAPDLRRRARPCSTSSASDVAPWFLDWYLAKTGYSGQMTKQPLDGGPDHDNLFQPVDGDEDRGAHGPFDERAHAHSFQTTLSKHRRLAGTVAAGVGAAATGAALLRKR